jgi:hypothetical protein
MIAKQGDSIEQTSVRGHRRRAIERRLVSTGNAPWKDMRLPCCPTRPDRQPNSILILIRLRREILPTIFGHSGT